MELPSLDQVGALIQKLGWAKGILTIFFIGAHWWIYRLYEGRLNDRQRQIDRVAEENREYRERFLKLLDREMGFTAPPERRITEGDEHEKKKKKER
jgi:hypothetical protein